MAMQDPAGGGRLVVVDASSFGVDAIVYTVSDGKTFAGFVQAGIASGTQTYKVNGIAQILPTSAGGGGTGFTPLPVTWPAGTIVSKSGSLTFYLQGNEL